MSEKVGADVQEVARGIGLDSRIGDKFLHAGPGYGGSCFPKDTLALVRTARAAGAPTRLIEATVEVNEARKRAMAAKVVAACGGSVQGKRIAVLGLTFKPETVVDAVVCNPPFHTARAADPGLGAGFIRAAAKMLHPGGTLWLVANRHLPYEQALREHFGDVAEIGGDTRFKILTATGARRPGAKAAKGRRA